MASGQASARPPRRVSLQYTRDERAQACIDPLSLARKVEAFTGPVLVAPSSAEIALEAHIEARPNGGFRARIQIGRGGENAHGERILETDSWDCRSFDDALSFVIATTIDPDLVLERVGALFNPTATPEKEALLHELAQTPTAPRAPAPATQVVLVKPKPKPKLPLEPRAEPQARARVIGVGLHLNDELAATGLGPAVLLRWQLYRWLALGVGAHTSFDVSTQRGSGGHVRRQELAGSLLLCPGLPWASRVRLAVCLGPEFFLLHVAARGFDQNKHGAMADTGFLLRPELGVLLGGPYSLRITPSARIGGQKTLTSSQSGIAFDLLQTHRVAVAVEVSVARAF